MSTLAGRGIIYIKRQQVDVHRPPSDVTFVTFHAATDHFFLVNYP